MNLGSTFYILLFYIILILLNFLLKLVGKFLLCAGKLYAKLNQLLFWRGTLRLWMEIYLDVGLAVTLGLK